MQIFNEQTDLNNREQELGNMMSEYLRNGDRKENGEKILELGIKILQEYPKAELTLVVVGDCYLGGIGTEKNIKEAKKYFLQSLNLGNLVARYEYAICLKIENNPECVTWLKKLTVDCDDRGVKAYANFVLGEIYVEGKIVNKDVIKAIQYYNEALKMDSEEVARYTEEIYFQDKEDDKYNHLKDFIVDDWNEDYPIRGCCLCFNRKDTNGYSSITGENFIENSAFWRNYNKCVKALEKEEKNNDLLIFRYDVKKGKLIAKYKGEEKVL